MQFKQKTRSNNKIIWINPSLYAKEIGRSPPYVHNIIIAAEEGTKPAFFEYKRDPKKPHRWLVKFDKDNIPGLPLKTESNSAGSILKRTLAEGKFTTEQIKSLQDSADTDSKIKTEKLKALQLSNKQKENLVVDKEKFNNNFFLFLRTARNNLVNLSPKLKAKSKVMTSHELEYFYLEEVKKILNELAEFKYYDAEPNSDNI